MVQAALPVDIIVLNGALLSLAPPLYYLPNPSGVAVPASMTGLDLLVDMTSLFSGDSLGIAVEWSTDGGVSWPEDHHCTMDIGSFIDKLTQLPTLKNVLAVSVQHPAGIDGQGFYIMSAYPTHARVRVDSLSTSGLAVVTLHFKP
jgi:hypothetical protein